MRHSCHVFFTKSISILILAKAEVYRNQGNAEYTKRNFTSAVHFYTEGIKTNCKDKELKVKLYSNQALAHFYLGENCYLTFMSC